MLRSSSRLTVILLHPLYAAALVGYIALVPRLLQLDGLVLLSVDIVVVGNTALLFIVMWSAITRKSGLVDDVQVAARRFAIGMTAGGAVTFFEGLLLITQPLIGALLLVITFGGLAVAAGTRIAKGAKRIANPATQWWPTISSGVWFGSVSVLASGILLFEAVVPRF